MRSRMFPVRIGIAEDEATGAAAVQLGARLGRAIDIRQGRGSRILAQPRDDGSVEIGGLSVLDEVREYPLPGVQQLNRADCCHRRRLPTVAKQVIVQSSISRPLRASTEPQPGGGVPAVSGTAT